MRLFALDFYEVMVDSAFDLINMVDSAFDLINYLNNRMFLSWNYRLIVAPRKCYVLKTKIEGKYASFKNIKFSRRADGY